MILITLESRCWTSFLWKDTMAQLAAAAVSSARFPSSEAEDDDL